MLCPFCSAELPETAAFCSRCGSNISRMRFVEEDRMEPEAPPKEHATPDPAPATSAKPSRALVVVAVVAAVFVIRLTFALFAPAPPNLLGSITGNSYGNEYFGFSYELNEGMAFASDEEVGQAYSRPSPAANASTGVLGLEDLAGSFDFDAMAYDPFASKLLLVTIIDESIPTEYSDDELLDALAEGVADASDQGSTTLTEQQRTTQTIDGQQLPTFSARLEMGETTGRFDTALIRIDDHAAAISVLALSDEALDDIFAHVRFGDVQVPDQDNAVEPTKGEPSYQAGTLTDNVYTNEFFGIKCKVPKGFESIEGASSPGAVADESGPFSSDANTEMSYSDKTTGETISLVSLRLLPSYTEAYTADEIIDNYARVLKDGTLATQLEQSGFTDVTVSEATRTLCGNDTPGLTETAKIRDVPFFMGQAFLVKDNRLMVVSVSSFDENRIGKLIGTIKSL